MQIIENKKRTRFDKNEIIIKESFAIIVIYDKKCQIKGETIISIESIEKCKNLKWHISYRKNKPYVFSRKNKKLIRLHRYVLNIDEKNKLEVDHIDGNTLNNMISNLRLCTHQENMMNQRILPSNNTSGFIGIYFDKKLKKWIAQIKVNKKHIHLGVFTDIEEAKSKRKEAEIKFFGINKFINFENQKE